MELCRQNFLLQNRVIQEMTMGLFPKKIVSPLILFYVLFVSITQCFAGEITWQERPLLEQPRYPGTYPGIFGIARGNDGYVLVSGNNQLFASKDCIQWTAQSNPLQYEFFVVSYQNGLYVAGGHEGAIIASSNGEKWSAVDSGDPVLDENFSGMTAGKGKFIGVGEMARIFISENGKKWQRVAPELRDSCGGMYLDWIIFENDMFLAVGDVTSKDHESLIVTSRDGINWTKQKSGVKKSLWRVVYGKGLYLASATNMWGERDATDSTSVIYSEDAIVWKKVKGLREYFNDMTFTGDYFIGVGKKGAYYISEDGLVWVKYTIKGFENRNLGFIYYKKAEKPEDKNMLLAITTTDIPLIAYEDRTATRFANSSNHFLPKTSERAEALHAAYTTNAFSISGRKISSAMRGGIPLSGTIAASGVAVRLIRNETADNARVESNFRK
jgi:hypothetical protein